MSSIASERPTNRPLVADVGAARATTRSARSRFDAADLAVAIATLVWLVVALLLHDPFYNLAAVLASTFLLGAAGSFYRWQPPPGRESFRLLGVFVLGQAFLGSGLAVITEVAPNPSFAIPTVESFSFSVLATTAFSTVFVAFAWVTGPRTTPAPADDVEEGPLPVVALALSIIATIVNVQFVLTKDKSGPLGVLPLIAFNLTLLGPMFVASALTTRNSMRAPIMILIAGQALVTFYTSMLMAVIFMLRDLAIAYIYLRRPLPRGLIVLMAVIVLVLNPVKMTFRYNVQQLRGGTEVTRDNAADFWKEGIDQTWGKSREQGTSASLDTTSDRLNYNWYFAHVYSTVPARFAFENGGTYEDIPMMLVPRLVYPDKPVAENWTRARWLIKLGIQTERSAETTAVSLPTVAEAYWNFGWAGVFAVPALLGLTVGGILRFQPRDRVVRTGFVTVVVVYMAVFIDMMVWIVPNVLIVISTAILAQLFSRIGRVRYRTGSAGVAATKAIEHR